MPSALILVANGTEEMEFVITYDVLVRAGIDCTSAFVSDNASAFPTPSSVVTCSRGVKIIADIDLRDLEKPREYDALIIPGGAQGAETLSGSSVVQQLVQDYYKSGKLVGMICAGSLVALRASIPRTAITSHPSVKNQLQNDFDYKEDSVVVSNNLITSRGPGK
ncbi:hypothetical protein FRC02_007739 [Tulasnella sp. 418]|nr:hypothetical protein FRC02_007739 [Tulasnella sp. 418]